MPVSVMLVAVALTYAGGVYLGLDLAVPERFRYYGIPITISADRYGLPGYVSHEEVAARFLNDKPIDQILSEDLPDELEPESASEAAQGRRLFFVPADDKGNTTFTRLAFRLFGPQARSLYWTYFALLLLSAVAFVVAFRAEPARLWAGAGALLAAAALVPAYQPDLLQPHVTTFYDPRSYGVIAILAALHLGFTAIDRPAPSIARLAAALYQASMIVFAAHMRFENVMLAVGLAVWVAGVGAWHGRAWLRTGLWRSLWPLALLAAVFAASAHLERRAYHPRYFDTHMTRHILWHNMGIGLALQPAFAERLRLADGPLRRVDEGGDGAMMETVAAALLAEGRTNTITRIFGAAYTNPTGDPAGATVDVGAFLHGAGSDLALYDQEVKRFVLATMAAAPWRTVELYFWYKPRYVFAHFLWFSGVTTSRPGIDAGGHQSPLFGGGARRPGMGGTPLAVFVGLLVAAFSRFAVGVPPSVWYLALAGSATLLVCTLAPMIVTYAAPFLMATPLAALVLTLLFLAALLVGGRGDGRSGAGRPGRQP
ncbi:MAG: hypothetical protein Q8L86_16440 [Vicinamibacterales bacterium]|nr:hypothetical protein [Vicinamibacterales bacterium]